MSLINQRRIKALLESRSEARRFIERCDLAIAELDQPDEGIATIVYASPAFAAAKRSSMDLTRALAALRRART